MNATITDAASASTKDLCAAMASAFSDYAVPINLTVPAFHFMMKQRGQGPDASRIAIINGQIAAIWLVSVRGEASYLISSGTVPQHRRRGLATDLAHSALEGLQRRGTMTFQTEVLVENTTAARLYRKLGMRTRRDLSCYTITEPQPVKDNTPPIREVLWSDIADKVHALRDWGRPDRTAINPSPPSQIRSAALPPIATAPSPAMPCLYPATAACCKSASTPTHGDRGSAPP